MNIDDYRAMKAAQEAEASQQATDQTQEASKKSEETKSTEVIEETKSTEVIEETKTEEVVEENKPTIPDEIELDGVGKVSFAELKNGYLRQSDYTKKTQEVARKKQEVEDAVTLFEYLKSNPQVAQKILEANNGELPDELNPSMAEVKKLRNQIADLKLEKEIERLSAKYDDFEVREVLTIAKEKQMSIENLEDAYLLVKSKKQPASSNTSLDVETLKKQLRDEIMKELKQDVDTSTIISPTDATAQVQDDTPKLSAAELKVARGLHMSAEEYAKWRDVKSKK